MKIVADCIE